MSLNSLTIHSSISFFPVSPPKKCKHTRFVNKNHVTAMRWTKLWNQLDTRKKGYCIIKLREEFFIHYHTTSPKVDPATSPLQNARQSETRLPACSCCVLVSWINCNALQYKRVSKQVVRNYHFVMRRCRIVIRCDYKLVNSEGRCKLYVSLASNWVDHYCNKILQLTACYNSAEYKIQGDEWDDVVVVITRYNL